MVQHTHSFGDEDIFDVVQIGYGPVGQVNAALLGREGLRVAVFERYPGLYGLPRAGHIDHEVMRIFQSLGCAEQIEADALRSNEYEWRNREGKTLIRFHWNAEGVSGWPSDYLIYQPYVEVALDSAVRRCPSVQVHHSWEAVDIEQLDDHVRVMLRNTGDEGSGGGQLRTVRARYVVASDGGSSFVRRKLEMPMTDLGFSQDWLVLDFREKQKLQFPFENGQICDPARPMCMFQLGQRHRRFAFMVLPGEAHRVRDPAFCWKLVEPWIGQNDAELIRQAPYVFESKLLETWRRGGVFFIGDAAHIMPPFMGQGMCSGIRDAANLAWKFGMVLRGEASEALLDVYERERKPHVRSVIDLSVAVGRVSCMVDVDQARQRDEAFLAGKAPPPPPFPHLTHGMLDRPQDEDARKIVGHLGPQARISLEGKIALADDLVGAGWHLISRLPVAKLLNREAFGFVSGLPLSILEVGDSPGDGHPVDVTGAYSRFFEAHSVDAILVRPDFYIFSAAAGVQGVSDMLLRLREQLDAYRLKSAA
ncbi:MAG: hypothetical protein JWQ07_4486 [Ramlibacter sp.]|nr:hypothetical protein [Ramlibacter sp.]